MQLTTAHATSRRELALSAAAALFGLAIGIALLPFWTRPAPQGQLPSYATTIHLDAATAVRFLAGLIVLPLVIPFAARRVIDRLASERSRAWARNGAAWSCAGALWIALLSRDPAWTIIPTVIAIATCYALREYDVQFNRRDIILLPSVLAMWLAMLDAFENLPLDRALVIATLVVLAVRLAVTKVSSPLPPGLSFLWVPFGLVLETTLFPRDQRYFGWHVIALTVIAPFITRRFLRNSRRAVAVLTFVVYPVACYAYMNATSLATAEGKPRVNFFEDAHHLVPASEMLRGERLYRDIVPTHGFIEDAAITWIAIKARGATIGSALRGRAAVGTLISVGAYAVTVAATGVTEAGFLAFLLATTLGVLPASVRVVPALFALAAIAASVRMRNVRAMYAGGFLTVLALMTSLDFGTYTLLTLIVSLLRYGRNRWSAIRNAAIGSAAAGLPFAGVLAAFGVLDDFFRVTLFELPAAATTGTLNVFTPPQGFVQYPHVPEVLAAIFTKPAVTYVSWIMAVILTGMLITRRVDRGTLPLLVVSFWMTVAGLSYAQRHHVFFEFATATLFVMIAWLVIRRVPALTPAIVVALLMMAQPTTHLAIAAWIRRTRGPIEQGWTEIRELPRACGALFTVHDAAVVRAASRYVEERLPGDNTFFDFTDRGSLYFLLRRDCPVRQIAVPFYETEELQRQVIARIDANPNVRAALVPASGEGGSVDNIPNQIRAPLVWKYVAEHFTPDHAEDDVAFWRRRQ